MHANADGGHFSFTLRQVIMVKGLDHRIILNGRQGDGVQDLTRPGSALFAQFKSAAAVSTGFVDRMHSPKGGQLFYGLKALHTLDFKDQSDGR